jgi:ethanolamine utilization protein EutM
MAALGMIETKGHAAAIAAADEMLKSADVLVFKKVLVANDLVTFFIKGDVGSVKAATNGGAEAAKRIGQVTCVDVIALPNGELLKALLDMDDKKTWDDDTQGWTR